ncbi:F-box/FBD/LRR-repeat protein [Senna tora]|uniref:F-box/FBD/LRR-repeat protein n=1 Tax=Senna tora TaxID=362788 RepID=A0A834WNL2_9FABA|nr:F-box/FBD/LRR-repeat protein [Senna tora]
MAAESSKSEAQKIDTMASISSLPNELLLKILSYLPLTQAVATSILSNTWKALCSQFLEDNYSRLAYFDDFALISPRRQKSIRLRRSTSDSDLIIRWIETAITQRQVEILDVSLCLRNVVPLPSSVFTCSTIVVLRLNNVILSNSGSDSDPVSVCLPSLKILHLKSVTFGSLRTVDNLLYSSTKILEDLVLHNISISGCQFVVSCIGSCRSFPKLIRANIDSSIFIPLDSAHNVESFRICPLHYRCFGHNPSTTFKNMVSMEVRYCDCWWEFLDTMMKYTTKLQNLVISKKPGGSFTPWIDHSNPVPKCLSSSLRTCCIKGFDSEEGLTCVLPLAKYIVENGRVLETITISCINQFAKDLINGELLSWQRSSLACQVNIVGGLSG